VTARWWKPATFAAASWGLYALLVVEAVEAARR